MNVYQSDYVKEGWYRMESREHPGLVNGTISSDSMTFHYYDPLGYVGGFDMEGVKN